MSAPLYRVWCRFEKDHINPLTGRRGQWRVCNCRQLGFYDTPGPSRVILRDKVFLPDELGMLSTKAYPRGAIIRPHRELTRVLAARRMQRAPLPSGRALVRKYYFSSPDSEGSTL